MSFQLKRIVFFFCILNFGLGGYLSNLAMAQLAPPKDPYIIWIPGVAKDVNSLKRAVNGFVFDKGGVGVKDVEIYDGNKLLAKTNEDGFYFAYILLGVQYTLTPKKGDFAFSPFSHTIPADGDDYFNINFAFQEYPRPVTLLSPSGTIYSSTPTYKWIASSVATSYVLVVDDSTGNKIHYSYSENAAGCNSGTCSVTPSTSLADGIATWRVLTCGKAGCFYWSNDMGFIVSAGDVTMSLDSKLDWQGTGFVVGQNMEIAIKATGTVTWMANNTSGPDGVVHLPNRVDERFLHEAILGKVGNGPVFLVGSSYRGKPGAGELKLITNDIRRVDNSGSFSVTITPWPLQE
jgi:hypothetical protein